MDSLFEKAQKSALEYMAANPAMWDVIKSMDVKESFMLTQKADVRELMDNIDKHFGYQHSGGSLALIMRFLQNRIPTK
jgi:hypothetical protein